MTFTYYDDSGEELKPDFMKMPSLCTICKLSNDPKQEVYCNLNRMDQADIESFECGAFISLDSKQNPDEEEEITF